MSCLYIVQYYQLAELLFPKQDKILQAVRVFVWLELLLYLTKSEVKVPPRIGYHRRDAFNRYHSFLNNILFLHISIYLCLLWVLCFLQCFYLESKAENKPTRTKSEISAQKRLGENLRQNILSNPSSKAEMIYKHSKRKPGSEK